jgi:predicted nucleic acid-binding Zn ribbon protein
MSEKPIGHFLKSFYVDDKMKEKLFEAKLKDKWAAITGPFIANYTESISLSQKILYLKINSAPLKQELSMGKAQILSIVNDCLGEPYVTEVRIV